MSSVRSARGRRGRAPGALLLVLLGATGCKGGGAPEGPHVPPSPRAAAPTYDVSEVPAPERLFVQAEIARPEALLKVASNWTRLPLPGGRDLLRALTDDGIAESVDLTQPIFMAGILEGGAHSVSPSAAFSVAVRSLEDARTRLAAQHGVTKVGEGQYEVAGIGLGGAPSAPTAPSARGEEEAPEGDDDGSKLHCRLAPAFAPNGSGARLVCGSEGVGETLAPYLTRTMPRHGWSSDVHVELLPKPGREPLKMLRAQIPIVAAGFLGNGSSAFREGMDALIGEVADFFDDADRISVDLATSDPGAQATVRVEYGHQASVMARAGVGSRGKEAAPPAAFWRLPGDADTAFFGRGTDPKLFDHAREILGKVFAEAAQDGGMTAADQKAVRELVVDRMFGLLTGPLVYAKGYDAAALATAIEKKSASKDRAAGVKAEATHAEQIAGWHLMQVGEPIAKVGPMLKDWQTLWNKPSMAAWKKARASAKMVAQMKVTPVPAGVTLPKETVHLEIVIPQADEVIAEEPIAATVDGGRSTPPKAPRAKPKTISVPPVTLHVFAIPDEGATWLALGLDGRLVARKASGVLAASAAKETLKERTTVAEPLQRASMVSAGFVSLRGVLVYGKDRDVGALSTLPAQGTTPVVFTTIAEGPSASAPVGSVVTTFQMPRAVVEDLVRLGMR